MINVLKEMVNYEILSQPLFLLIAISNVFGMLGFYVPFVYLPNMAVLQGIPVENANFLLSIIGISNTIGKNDEGVIKSISFFHVMVAGLEPLNLCQGGKCSTAVLPLPIFPAPSKLLNFSSTKT
jgi:predicted MFS family arabinose efflux permease